MKIQYLRSNGIIINSLVWFLEKVSFPIDWSHNKLKKCIVEKIKKKKNSKWNESDIEGLFIEIWDISWTLINIFVLLPLISNKDVPLILYLPLILIFALRSADLLKVLFATNFNLCNDPQRSLSRAFALLALAFFELGAIFTTIQFIICKDFKLDLHNADWLHAYYYSLRNMVTIGGGDITAGTCITIASKLFGLIRILQPLLSVMLVAFAINNIHNWRHSNSKININE